ncbi:MAG: oligosaccharide flippase family protein [Flavobacteriaceae bacterium]|nr:oligosaccharide flippase family protein [Flavobacteriaceae bacterium]
MKFFNNNPLLKVLSLNSISVAVSFVLGILSTKIISLFLGAPGMAVIGSLRNFTTMLKSMATLGINNSVVKFVVENKNDKKELSIIYSTFFWLFLIISSLLGLTTLLFSKSISELLFFSDYYVIPIQIFGLILPLLVINTFWLAIYNGLEEFKKVIYIQIISNILIFLVTAILIWKQKVLGGLLSIVFGELIMVFVTFIYVRNSKEYFVFDLQKIIDKKCNISREHPPQFTSMYYIILEI